MKAKKKSNLNVKRFSYLSKGESELTTTDFLTSFFDFASVYNRVIKTKKVNTKFWFLLSID